jgi:predicted RNase H-like HicB family nuclease
VWERRSLPGLKSLRKERTKERPVTSNRDGPFLFLGVTIDLWESYRSLMSAKLTIKVLIDRDADGFYLASVPALRGCDARAETFEALIKRVRELVELRIENLMPVDVAFDLKPNQKGLRRELKLIAHGHGGLQPGVDLDNTSDLLDRMDGLI